MKLPKILIILIVGFISSLPALAQTSFTATSGTWSTPGNWSAGVPDITDAVTIPADRIVTVDVDAECASITYTAGTINSSIILDDGVTLTVSGTIQMNAPTANNTIQTLDVANGIVNCNALTMGNPSDTSRRNRLDIGNGTINITTTLTMSGGAAGENELRFIGNGTLNYSGATFGLSTNDRFIRGNGTIELSRNGDCTLSTSIFYNRVVVSGTGNKSIGSTSMNKLYIRPGGTALANNTVTIQDSTIIDGTFSVTSTSGNKTFNGHILLNPSGTWNITVSEGFAINNGFTNMGTFNPNTGTYTFGVNTMDLNGPTDFIFLGAVTVASPAVVNNYDSVSVPGTFTVASGGTWVNQANSSLRMAGTTTLTGTFTCSAVPNMVHFDRNNTQVSQAGETYYNVMKSNTSALTLGAGTTTVLGNLIVNSPCTITVGANTLDIEGSLAGTGAVTQSAGGNIFLAGDNLNTGTFTPSTATFTYDGSNQQVKATTYNNLSIDGSGIKTMAGNVIVSGTSNFIAGELAINGNRLTINGAVSRTAGFIRGSETSSITVGGTAANAGLFFSQADTSSISLSNLTSTRANGTTINNTLAIVDSLNVSTGTISSDGNIILRSDINKTARIARIVSGGISGNIIAQRFIPGGNGKRKWRYLSSPVNISGGIKIWQLIDDVHVTGEGNVANGFDDCTTCAPSLRTYTESVAGDVNQGWTNPADTSVSIPTGAGFELFVRGNRTTPTPYINWAVPNHATIDYIGTVNSGAINVNIPRTDNGVTEADGFNFVGNPYPSQIDWLSSGWTKTNLELFFWTYNPDPAINAYGIFSTVLGTGTNDITRYIASGQGFYVKATADPGTLGFTENVKRGDAPFNFYRQHSASAEPAYVKISASNATYRDELIIAVDSAASLIYGDAADALKFFGSNLNFYSKSADEKSLAINQTSYPRGSKEDTIALSIFSYEGPNIIEGEYSIQISDASHLPANLGVDLLDLNTSTRVVLTDTARYRFQITNNLESFGNQRFRLILYNKATGIAQGAPRQTLSLYPNPASKLVVVLGSEYGVVGNARYEVYSMDGRLVLSGVLVNNYVDVSTLVPGVYVVSVGDVRGRLVVGN
jgi:hypothetical protein